MKQLEKRQIEKITVFHNWEEVNYYIFATDQAEKVFQTLY